MRVSVIRPGKVLANGIAQKLVPYPLPTFVLRQKAVRSAKPPGVKSAPPMRNDSGDSFGRSCSGVSDAVDGVPFFWVTVLNVAGVGCTGRGSSFADTIR